MSTLNGFGTLRYDWSHLDDGTAEATLWIVAAFLPVVPLKRERLLVVSEGLERSRAIEMAGVALGAAVGVGSGFRSQLQVLDRAPMKLSGIVRTYLFGYVVTPLLAFGAPLAFCWLTFWLLAKLEVDQDYRDIIFIAVGIAAVAWMGVVIAKILDRAAGRQTPNRMAKKEAS